MAPIDSWLESLVRFPDLVEWPKARAYELVDSPRGLAIQASGPLETADPAELGAAAPRLASWGTPDLRDNREGLLRLVNNLGLTGPWERSTDGVRWQKTRGVKWEEARGARMRPPLSQSLDEFRRDVKRVKEAFLGYEVGYVEVRRGDRDPLDSEGEAARIQLGRVVVPEAQRLLSEIVYWSPTTTVAFSDPPEMRSGQLWGLKRPPSLVELAMAEIIAAFQDRIDVRRCQNPDCGRPFTSQSPRGSKGDKAWTRPDVMYCRHECGKHAAYLRRKGE
jgi:hypothetical protein